MVWSFRVFVTEGLGLLLVTDVFTLIAYLFTVYDSLYAYGLLLIDPKLIGRDFFS